MRAMHEDEYRLSQDCVRLAKGNQRLTAWEVGFLAEIERELGSPHGANISAKQMRVIYRLYYNLEIGNAIWIGRIRKFADELQRLGVATEVVVAALNHVIHEEDD